MAPQASDVRWPKVCDESRNREECNIPAFVVQFALFEDGPGSLLHHRAALLHHRGHLLGPGRARARGLHQLLDLRVGLVEGGDRSRYPEEFNSKVLQLCVCGSVLSSLLP